MSILKQCIWVSLPHCTGGRRQIRLTWDGLCKYWSQVVRNNLSRSNILVVGCVLDRSQQTGGPGMDWVSPERQAGFSGRGSRSGGARPAGPPFRKSLSKNYLKSSILGGCVRGASTIIHWSLRFGIQSKQNSLRWMYEPNIESTKHVLVAFGAESKPALNQLHSTILLSIKANFCFLCSFRVKLGKT